MGNFTDHASAKNSALSCFNSPVSVPESLRTSWRVPHCTVPTASFITKRSLSGVSKTIHRPGQSMVTAARLISWSCKEVLQWSACCHENSLQYLQLSVKLQIRYRFLVFIKTLPATHFPRGRAYLWSIQEQRAMEKYIKEALGQGYDVHLTSPASGSFFLWWSPITHWLYPLPLVPWIDPFLYTVLWMYMLDFAALV